VQGRTIIVGRERHDRRVVEMKFIVPPQKDETQDRICSRNVTLCWLCSEDPRACGDLI
jgi:hypothetical protein